MKCEVCNQGPPNGPTVYRVNEPGEMPGIWRCRNHVTEEQLSLFDKELKEIVGLLESIPEKP